MDGDDWMEWIPWKGQKWSERDGNLSIFTASFSGKEWGVSGRTCVNVVSLPGIEMDPPSFPAPETKSETVPLETACPACALLLWTGHVARMGEIIGGKARGKETTRKTKT
jgi:hypothetical protein